ncbi:mitochondrial ribosome-associated GTPase 2-like [Mercenaria mercenaria]|uniref:mitochondrial ribosome-associated GTPase 2-like n=1 Tax=Mercenaria mercenaria TaxID=6596 RepID=UPI00234F7E03|nr:mitochondrial ribosome-associated GTPase 2-like [Mercenaria mercenaria]XP_053400978.1 mitochondrial ribosome-associated GTPase 2-like [Mercenaria mercenaria]
MVLLKSSFVCGKSVWINFLRRYTARPIKPRKAKAEGSTTEHFVDFKKVQVLGGRGGNGCISFHSEPRKEFGGPDGGNGGHGGHVIITCTRNKNSLGHLKSVIKAESGINGRNSDRHGKNAEHFYNEVPIGTVVRDEEGKELSSLDCEREYYIAARGGAGGKGNKNFASSEDTTPRYAEEGAPGEDRVLYLELKTMAHAGLIGFPNAGKSTLLRAISRARPKVAPYPFTTLHPHVGIVEYDDFEQVAVADIPGLIPDAHKNRGLGISFLRHIERCVCLLFVIDLSVDEPWMQLDHLKFELEQYKAGLSERPHAVIGNKMDLEISKKNFIELQKRTDMPLFPVSAEKRLNLKPLLMHLRKMYDINNVEGDYG